MKIFLVGGGSGGHITPALAVASSLRQYSKTDLNIGFVIARKDSLLDVVRGDKSVDSVHEIYSGKLRRYHGEGLKQLLDFKTVFLNIRDIFRVVAGFFQSCILLYKQKPDLIFIKGGFVGVPIGLASALFKIPYITHDSDAVPGLANRIISRWAVAHAVAMPIEAYNYPKGKTYQTGVPVTKEYTMINRDLQAKYKRELGIPSNSPVICVTGGGLGAQRLNESVVRVSERLLAVNPDLHILHIAGRGKTDSLDMAYDLALKDKKTQVSVKGFVDNMYVYTGAADVVVARAGANSLAELAVQAKACIIVPNPQLTGGHQVKNAQILEKKNAIVHLQDTLVTKNPEILQKSINELLASPSKRLGLAKNIHKDSKKNAAELLAKLILECAQKVSN